MNNLYEESVRRIEARIRREILLGRDTHTGRLVYISPEHYLASHWHLLGPSNFGKSYLMEHELRELTTVGIPASLFDPHGDHAKHYHDFLQRIYRSRKGKRVIYLKAGSATNGVGFNPFNCGLTHPGEIASLVLEALMKVWGAETFNETPRLERILRNMFYLFAANKLPLTEAYQFLLVSNHAFREKLTALAPDERVRLNWKEIERLPQGEKLERFESSWNRLQRFIGIPAIERLFAEQTTMINFAEIFDRRQTLVADYGLLRSTEAQSIAGTMLINAMYHAAKRRPEGRRRHWFLAIDEFPQFVTTDIARSLDQLRKFGVRLILAHQHLDQMPRQLLASVMTNAKIRFVFGGSWRPDAEILARELFTGIPGGDRIKYQGYQTKFRPRLEERDIETFSESSTEGDGESDGSSEGRSNGSGDSFGGSYSEHRGEDGMDETHGTSSSWSSSRQENRGSSRSRSHSRSTNSGRSRSTTFVTEHDEFEEASTPVYWSLDEQWEELVAHLANLDQRQTLVKVLNKPVVQIETPEIKHRALPRNRPLRLKKIAAPINEVTQDAKTGKGSTLHSTISACDSDELPEDFHE